MYQLQGPGSDWGERFLQLPADAFNNRPYHYEQRLDEHFICHFALPGGRRPKADLIAEFAERLGTNVALVPPELIEPYREFLEYSDMGAMLGIVRAEAASSAPAPRSGRGPPDAPRRARRPLGPAPLAGPGCRSGQGRERGFDEPCAGADLGDPAARPFDDRRVRQRPPCCRLDLVSGRAQSKRLLGQAEVGEVAGRLGVVRDAHDGHARRRCPARRRGGAPR